MYVVHKIGVLLSNSLDNKCSWQQILRLTLLTLRSGPCISIALPMKKIHICEYLLSAHHHLLRAWELCKIVFTESSLVIWIALEDQVYKPVFIDKGLCLCETKLKPSQMMTTTLVLLHQKSNLDSWWHSCATRPQHSNTQKKKSSRKSATTPVPSSYEASIKLDRKYSKCT